MATRAWSETTPANSDNINQGAYKIRETRADVRERMEIDHVWNVSASTDGYHNKTTLPDQGSRPSTASGFSKIWAEASGGVSQPFMKDGAGNVRQLGVPVGAICAYLPGYFTAAANVGYTAVSMTLPDGWVLCDGAAPNDALSPIWNSPTRRVPDLDDARFLSGNTAANRGVAGGSNTITAHTATYPDHTHAVTDHTVTVAAHNMSHTITQPTFSVPDHNHRWFLNSSYAGYTYYPHSFKSDGTTEPMLLFTGSGGISSPRTAAGYELPSGDGRYTANTSLSLTQTGNVAISNHTDSHTASASAHSVTSSGGGTVTIGSNHSTGDNLPQYLCVSFIIKIK